MAGIDPKLGSKVSTRTINWNDEVIKAWGSEFRTPDHDIYRFSGGNNKDSTDKGKTGLYGVPGDNLIYLNNQYPDMRDGILVNADGVTPGGAQNNGFGSFVDIAADSLVTSAVSGGNVVETDPQFPLVQLLNFGTTQDFSNFSQTLTTVVNAISVPITNGPMGATTAWQSNSLSDCRLSVAANSIWSYPSNATPFALTIEYSLFIVNPTINNGFIMSLSGGTYCQFGGTSPTIRAGVVNYGTDQAPSMSNGQWYNIAHVVDETSYRLFVNGAQKVTGPVTTTALLGSNPFAIMGIAGQTGYGISPCFITNVRITWGFARYGGDYTPRTTPFPISGP